MIFHRQPRKTMDRITIAAAAASGRRLTSLSVSMKLPSGIFRKASQRNTAMSARPARSFQENKPLFFSFSWFGF